MGVARSSIDGRNRPGPLHGGGISGIRVSIGSRVEASMLVASRAVRPTLGSSPPKIAAA
jgi:hypothetical protein